MAKVSDPLSVSALEERYKACSDATTARHVQAIWLLAQGHTAAQVSATMAFGERWVHQLLERYNAEGPDALGDLRRRNGRSATILTPAVLDKLRVRLADAPPDGGVWSSGQGGGVSGRATRPGEGSGAARLGGASGGRLVAAAASTEEPEVRFGRGGGGF